jgi:hypothetical protein
MLKKSKNKILEERIDQLQEVYNDVDSLSERVDYLRHILLKTCYNLTNSCTSKNLAFQMLDSTLYFPEQDLYTYECAIYAAVKGLDTDSTPPVLEIYKSKINMGFPENVENKIKVFKHKIHVLETVLFNIMSSGIAHSYLIAKKYAKEDYPDF